MVDNVTADPASGGATFATDDDGTAHHPYVKLEFGADNTQTKVSSSNPLPVEIADGTGTIATDISNILAELVIIDAYMDTTQQKLSNVAYLDDDDWTDGVSSHFLTGGVFQSTPQTVTDGDTGPFLIDTNGRLAVVLSPDDNAAIDAITTALGGTLVVDGSAVTQPVSGTVTANLGATDNAVLDVIASAVATDDAAFTAAAGTGTPIMGFFSTDTVDAGDVGVLAMDASRRLFVSLEVDNAGLLTTSAHDAAFGTAGTADAQVRSIQGIASMTPVQVSQATASNLNAQVVGNVASAATDSGNPVKMGAIFNTTPPTFTTGQRVNLQTNSRGSLHVTPGPANSNFNTNVAQMNGVATAMGNGASSTGTQRVTIASDSTGQVKLAAGTASIGTLGANTGVDIGDVDVTSISAGSNLIGDVGLSGARTSGGTTIFRSIDLDESEEEVKATAGQVYWIHCMNLSAATKFLKVYNATAATVVVGTTTPVLTFPIPTTGDTNGAGFVLNIPNGIAFSTAITVAATTGIADADTGAPGANEVIINLGYA